MNGQHVREGPEVVGGSAAGTLRYIALYAHRHRILSRRDDIESIGYVLIYLLKGNVPWASQTDDVKAGKSERVLKSKLETTLEVCAILISHRNENAMITHFNICFYFNWQELIGPENPTELLRFMTYARSLSFYQKPNYDYLRRLLRDALVKIGASEDNFFDWSEPRHVIQIPKNDKNFFWDIPRSIVIPAY